MPQVWDLFCRVIDNFGDIGVCWRLASDLAERGATVRLWTDDASPLRWMAPRGCAGVTVLPWEQARSQADCGDVVIEAFACELPQEFVSRMANRSRPPVWINLDYLTAQGYAQRCHGLPSPQFVGAGTGLTKWFFQPGFVPGTGGLIRERNLASRQSRFDKYAWRAGHGIEVVPGERCVSLFCYDNAALPAMLDALAEMPTVVLAAPGVATELLAQCLGPKLQRGALRCVALPWFSQEDFDHLLWSSDLNFVRGEDSWVRAQWAEAPFVWQAYVQDDAAHHAKLDAFTDLYLARAPTPLAERVRGLWLHWNRRTTAPFVLPDLRAWQAHQRLWSNSLREQCDLTSELMRFTNERR